MQVFVLGENEEIATYLREHDEGSWTTSVLRGTFSGKRAIGLVQFGAEGFSLVGRVERAGHSVTLQDRLRLSELTEIEPPITLDELRNAMPSGLRRFVGYGLLPERTGERVLEALVELRPSLDAALNHLQIFPSPESQSRGAGVAAMEKDAVGLALNITGFDRAEAGNWGGDPTRPAGFLQGLTQTALREDPIIQHDQGTFRDWEILRGDAVVNSVRFERAGATLTVLNVNRGPIEEALGVDLIYYHEGYAAFVMVQYKRMRKEPSLGWVYRPDANHDKEVERMQEVLPTPPDPVNSLNYRLNFGPCLFKLCESVGFDPYTTDLIPGMYLPLEFFMASSETAQGPQGGSAYGYQTVPRHLNNTQFVDLVQDGWIGSSGALTDSLRGFVEARVEDGRSIMFCIGDRPLPAE